MQYFMYNLRVFLNTNVISISKKKRFCNYCWLNIPSLSFLFSQRKHYFALVSKRLHHRPPKIQQPSLWPSHQSGHSPHLIYNKSIHNSYNLVICTISIHSYSTQALMEAIGGNNHRGAWQFHSDLDDDMPTIEELPHFSRNFD